MTVVFGIGVLTILLVVVVGIVYLWVLAVKSIVEAINKDGLLKDAERERDELRQQLEDAKSKCRLDQSENSGIGHCTGCGHVIDPVADAIADAMGRQSKEKFEKAWDAGKQDAHDSKDSQADPYAELLDYEAEPVAYQWLRVHGLIGSTDEAEFVKLADDNAGLILAAFPEQVDSIGTGSSQGVSVGGPSSIEVPFYVFGTWLRVESDHLTPATDEETKALKGRNSEHLGRDQSRTGAY